MRRQPAAAAAATVTATAARSGSVYLAQPCSVCSLCGSSEPPWESEGCAAWSLDAVAATGDIRGSAAVAHGSAVRQLGPVAVAGRRMRRREGIPTADWPVGPLANALQSRAADVARAAAAATVAATADALLLRLPCPAQQRPLLV